MKPNNQPKQVSERDRLVGYYISKGYGLVEAYNMAYSGVSPK